MSKDHSEQIAGARAKSFLALTLYDLVEELSRCAKEWEPRVSQVITSAVKRTFSSSDDKTL